MSRKLIIAIAAVVVVGGGGIAAWLVLSKPALPPGFSGANGRLEAKKVDIATKYQGRIKEVLADEGARTIRREVDVVPSRTGHGGLDIGRTYDQDT